MIPLLLTFSLAAQPAGPPKSPHAPDDHTLLLHHFDDHTERGGLDPDLARGTKTAYWGSKAKPSFVAGKFGKALWFGDRDSGLRFTPNGNYHVSAGTVELFVRPAFPGNVCKEFKLFFEAKGHAVRKCRVAIGRGDFNSARTKAKPSDLFADLQDGQLGMKVDVSQWEADEWHHVALLWDEKTARFLVDGVRVAEGRHTALSMPEMLVVGARSNAAIDELRISDVMRVELEKENRVKTETAFKPIGSGASADPKDLPPLPKASPRPDVVRISTGASQLFVDDYLIRSSTNLFRRLGAVRKYEGNPVVLPDQPWEEVAAFPFSGGAYRLAEGNWVMWYQTYRRWLRGSERTSGCFATSADGIRWTKPELRLHTVASTTPNNVVLSTAFDNFSVLHDPGDPDEGRRYKAAVYTGGSEGAGVYGYVSPDGVDWTRLPEALVPKAGDRTSLWHDTLRKKYVLFTRYSPIYPGRHIFQSESDDFVSWSKPRLILHWSNMDRVHGIQHYGANGFAYGDMYLGTLEVFHVPCRRLDTQLFCSRDCGAWSRVCEGEPFLPNGPEDAFDRFWAFPAATPPIRVGDDLWFYYSGRMHPHGPPSPPIHPGRDDSKRPRHAYYSATGLAKMRLDGFAAMDATGEEGRLITVPISFERGSTLHINADADNFPAKSSWLKVGILDQAMSPIDGFGVYVFDTLAADAVDHVATWKGQSDVSSLAGKPIRLDFRLVNTRLYSFTVR